MPVMTCHAMHITSHLPHPTPAFHICQGCCVGVAGNTVRNTGGRLRVCCSIKACWCIRHMHSSLAFPDSPTERWISHPQVSSLGLVRVSLCTHPESTFYRTLSFCGLAAQQPTLRPTPERIRGCPHQSMVEEVMIRCYSSIPLCGTGCAQTLVSE